MGSSKVAIVWFRRDLRIEDNPALSAAARDGRVLPVFIWCPTEEAQFYPGRVSRWWLKQSLIHLGQSLKSLGSELILMKADCTFLALLDCIHAVGATRVVFNHLYDPVSLVRDHRVKEKLVEHGISVQSYNADLLVEPWTVFDEGGLAFTTFDEYWNKCLKTEMEPVSHTPAWRLVPPTGFVSGSYSIEDLGLENETERSSNALLGRGWDPGWGNADKTLAEFMEHHLAYYAENRSKLVGNSTALLSPHLHFGEVSIRKVFRCTVLKHILWAKEGNSLGEESTNLFLRAIGLREYSRYLCFNFPFTHERSLLGNLKYFPWCCDQSAFKAWRQGRTGYPLVDAGMRELWATGWIHNRIRVIVSSFAVKFLLIPWRWGMKYFWDTLLDADLESDILGWQYISGSLPDGHELERMDCPEVQGSKYDPEGEYVRQWLPELARIPTAWIHHPWDASTNVLQASGVELGSNYPKPIIDVDSARDRLREAIFKMWELEAADRTTSPNHSNETIGDSTEVDKNLFIPKVTVKDRGPRPIISPSDQMVPVALNPQNVGSSKKRPNEVAKAGRDVGNEAGPSRIPKDLHSTAESSSAKRQTMIRNVSIPQYNSSSGNRTRKEQEAQPQPQPQPQPSPQPQPRPRSRSICLKKRPWQEQVDM